MEESSSNLNPRCTVCRMLESNSAQVVIHRPEMSNDREDRTAHHVQWAKWAQKTAVEIRMKFSSKEKNSVCSTGIDQEMNR